METPEENGTQFDPTLDRHPRLDVVLAALSHVLELPDGPIERIEIYCTASGDASTRVWTPRAEEPVVGFLDSETLGQLEGDFTGKVPSSAEGSR